MSAPTITKPVPQPPFREIPPLENGDHLTRDEFERRYEAMPELKKAELIEGEVHMPSPVRGQITRQYGWTLTMNSSQMASSSLIPRGAAKY
jgi:hypothetical protein